MALRVELTWTNDGDLSLEEGWAPNPRWLTLEVLIGIQYRRSHRVQNDANEAKSTPGKPPAS